MLCFLAPSSATEWQLALPRTRECCRTCCCYADTCVQATKEGFLLLQQSEEEDSRGDGMTKLAGRGSEQLRWQLEQGGADDAQKEGGLKRPATEPAAAAAAGYSRKRPRPAGSGDTPAAAQQQPAAAPGDPVRSASRMLHYVTSSDEQIPCAAGNPGTPVHHADSMQLASAVRVQGRLSQSVAGG